MTDPHDEERRPDWWERDPELAETIITTVLVVLAVLAFLYMLEAGRS